MLLNKVTQPNLLALFATFTLKARAMKKFLFPLVAAGWMLVPTAVYSQDEADSTGLPGDNFDLQGAMELFKNASSLEAFEQSLNTQSNDVNNLDLNDDGKTDYVRVTDRTEGTSHAIVMQVPVNASEFQDVAAIVIEKTADSTAHMQIVGDEELYGSEKVMQPYDEVAEKTTTGPSAMFGPMRVVIVNVWGWPCVRYIYRPAYVIYVSPWYWDYYPIWWSPWRPIYWRTHWAHVHRYHTMYYQPAQNCYLHHAHSCYMQHRAMSHTVATKYAAPHANYKMQQANGGRAKQQAAANGKAVQGTNNRAQTKGLEKKGTGAQTATPNTGKGNVKKVETTAPSNSNRGAVAHPQTHTTTPRPNNNGNRQPAQATPRPQSHPAPQQRGGNRGGGNRGGQPQRSAPVQRGGGGGGGGRQGMGHR